jgi:hypothetical protein
VEVTHPRKKKKKKKKNKKKKKKKKKKKLIKKKTKMTRVLQDKIKQLLIINWIRI